MDHGEWLRRSSRHAGNVKRYHAWPTIRQQTVGDHSFHVLRLYIDCFGMPPQDTLYHIVYHDLGELSAGDTPFPAKRIVPGLREAAERAELWGLELQGLTLPELTDQERVRFKFCDLMEMWEFARVEHQLGNNYALPIQLNIEHYVSELVEENPSLKIHYDTIKRRMY